MTSVRNKIVATFLAGMTLGLPPYANADSLKLRDIPVGTSSWIESAPALCVGVNTADDRSWSIGQSRCPAGSQVQTDLESGFRQLPNIAPVFSISW